MHKYKYVDDKLVLEGCWSSFDIPLLMKLIKRCKNVEITGTVSNNIRYIINNKMNGKIADFQSRIEAVSYVEEKSYFLTNVIKMQIKLLKKLGDLSSSHYEAFKNYFVSAFKEMTVDSFFLTSFMSGVIGIAIVLEGYAQLHYLGVEAFTMHFFTAFVFREMIPIMNAVLLASKCATAISAKISMQKINSEIKMLNLMNISDSIILKPKLLASMLALPVMNVYSLFFATLSGMVAYAHLASFNFKFAFHSSITYLNMTNFLISQAKSLIFGWWIGLVICTSGMLYDFGTANLGRAIVKSIVYSISGIIIFDMIAMFICTKMGI